MSSHILDNTYGYIPIGNATTSEIKVITDETSLKFIIYDTDLQKLLFYNGVDLKEIILGPL